jgi:glycosyltransferase involved in cell wall biosynthesis
MATGTTVTREADSDATGLSVLQLTTSPDAGFFKIQVETLEARGIACETLAVPGQADGRKADSNRSPLDYLRFFAGVRRELAAGEYDLVHANYGLTAPHALAASDVPVVLSLWGSDVHGPMGWLSKLAAPHADAVVVMSEAMGRALGTDYTVLPHGIDRSKFRPMPQSLAHEVLDWRSDAHHVLFPSPIARTEKDFPRARRVVRAARDALDSPVVLHAPDGEVAHDRMPLYMNGADALLLTSRREGFPNAVKEAMACNCPVVATDVGSLRRRLASVTQSTVADSDDGLVTGLVTALESPGRSNGRQAVADLDHETVAQRMEAVYRRVLDGEGTRADERATDSAGREEVHRRDRTDRESRPRQGSHNNG